MLGWHAPIGARRATSVRTPLSLLEGSIPQPLVTVEQMETGRRRGVVAAVVVGLGAVLLTLQLAGSSFRNGSDPQTLPTGTYTLTIREGAETKVVTVRYADARHWEVERPPDDTGLVRTVVMDGGVTYYREEGRVVSDAALSRFGFTVDEFGRLSVEEQEAVLGKPPWVVQTEPEPLGDGVEVVPDFAMTTPDQLGSGFNSVRENVHVREANGFVDTFVYHHPASPFLASEVRVEAADGTVTQITIEFSPSLPAETE